MKVGFTGTQAGMSNQQYNAVGLLLKRLHATEGHHGDCIGADAQFNKLCIQLDIPIVLHPPLNPKKRAFCMARDLVHRPKKDYLERNKDIVNECDVLIACPKSNTEELRSGTWSTVRYAKKNKVRVIIVFPDGQNQIT